MKYTTEDLFERSKKIIVDKELIFVEDVCAMLGINKTTFYDRIKIDTNEFNTLRGLLDENKISIKTKLRKKWFDSDNATTQMALYKLCSTDVEHKKLQQNYTDHTTAGDKLDTPKTTIVFRDYEAEAAKNSDNSMTEE